MNFSYFVFVRNCVARWQFALQANREFAVFGVETPGSECLDNLEENRNPVSSTSTDMFCSYSKIYR